MTILVIAGEHENQHPLPLPHPETQINQYIYCTSGGSQFQNFYKFRVKSAFPTLSPKNIVQDPAATRPITCSPILYEFINGRVNAHLEANNILS